MIKNNIRLILVTLVFFLSACTENSTTLPTPNSTQIPTSTPFPTTTATPDFDSLLEPGWEALSSENYELAESLADSVLEVDNQHGNAWLLKGLAKSYRGDYRDAILDLEKAKNLGSDNAEEVLENNYIGLFNEIMDLLYKTWDTHQLLNYINETHEIFTFIYNSNPSSGFVQEYYPIFRYTQEDLVDLTNINDDAIEHYSLGEEYFINGYYESAIEEYKIAIKIEPEFSFAYLYLGDAYYSLGDFGNSEIYMKKAVEINPLISEAWAYLGDTYRNLSLPQHARETYIKALLLNKNNTVATSGFALLKYRESWVTDFFEKYGFALDLPEPIENELFQEGGSGAALFYYDSFVIKVFWDPTLSSLDSTYEQNLAKNLYFINNYIEVEVGGNYKILDKEAYEFLFGVTKFAVQPFYIYPPVEIFRIDNAIVSARCGNHTVYVKFEFGYDTTGFLDLQLAPVLESFRCDLEEYQWFNYIKIPLIQNYDSSGFHNYPELT